MSETPFRESGQTAFSEHSVEPGRRRRSRLWLLVWGTVLLVAMLAVLLLSHEARTSRWQAWALERYAAPMAFEVAPGPSEHIRFPKHGPFDERLGYTRIPAFLHSSPASRPAASKSRSRRDTTRLCSRTWIAACTPLMPKRHRPG